MSLPKVSCYCATYGRPWALEQSIESFLRQDYAGEKELVVLNDYSGHTLLCNSEGVKVFNVPERIIPLGKKFNETVALCDGDVLLPWEDDDIFLPNRINFSVQHLKNGFFHTHLAFFEKTKEQLIVSGNHYHCNMAVSRKLWNKVGGYSEIDTCDLDVKIMNRLKRESGHTHFTIPKDQIFYVYRWGSVRSYHASGWGKGPSFSVSAGATGIVEKQNREGKVPQGEYLLNPHWDYDYVLAAKRTLQSLV